MDSRAPAIGLPESSRMIARSPHRSLLLIGLVILLIAAPAAVPQPPANSEPAAQLIADARASISRIRDYSGTLVKQERIAGQLQPEQFIEMRVRQQPFCVFLKWTAPKQF